MKSVPMIAVLVLVLVTALAALGKTAASWNPSPAWLRQPAAVSNGEYLQMCVQAQMGAPSDLARISMIDHEERLLLGYRVGKLRTMTSSQALSLRWALTFCSSMLLGKDSPQGQALLKDPSAGESQIRTLFQIRGAPDDVVYEAGMAPFLAGPEFVIAEGKLSELPARPSPAASH